MSRRRRFQNLHATPGHHAGHVLLWKLGLRRDRDEPPDPPAVPGGVSLEPVAPDLEAIRRPEPEHLAATWIGHSSFLIQHAGQNLLVDPVFSSYCAPLPLPTLKRRQAPGLTVDQLPSIDAVLITHSHYDHLDRQSIIRLGPSLRYLVPPGLGRWFAKRGFSRVNEVAWWDSIDLGNGLTVRSVPAQHFSARSGFDRDTSHWCGWILEWPRKRAYHVGDSGYAEVFEAIGSRFGPFDMAFIPIGAYRPRWLMRPMHVNPSEAVRIHGDVRAKLSIAAHWGTFRLTDEPLSEPPVLLARALAREGIEESSFRVLRIGESIRV